ncbi:MAG: hypothetical protein HYV02_07615 [Deltaproteobacteria bacterium]|nr:hypothetical protein [Deltaproteobacteria bacterium]
MESGTTVSVKDFSDWLAWIEQFPLVPGWQWTSKSWYRFSDRLARAGIAHCRDVYGNVLLGTHTMQRWFANIRNTTTRLVLHAHLDHPGAIVTHHLDDATTNGWHRYSAVVQGGLPARLIGRRMMLCDADGDFVEEVLIDTQRQGLKESWISFQTKSVVRLPGYLRGPHHNNLWMVRKDWFEGWGLDDHVGCAAILAYYVQHRPQDLLGLLTLDEEIGFSGLHAHRDVSIHFGIAIQDWPMLYSLEVTPEYPALAHFCGQGTSWRRSDRRGVLTDWLGVNPLDLTNGSCEASQWVRWGGRAACLVTPSEFAHNGRREQEWRAERVTVADVVSLQEQLAEGVRTFTRQDRVRSVIAPQSTIAHPDIRVHDHLQPLRKAAYQSGNYVDSLHKVLPTWNALHARFGLPAITFAQEDWDQWKKSLLSSEQWTKRIRACATECFHLVRQWCGDARSDPSVVDIHVFAGAPFNAANRSYGIALSMEKLKPHDLQRVLMHEMIHTLTNPLLQSLRVPSLMKSALGEGLACKATIDLLGISPARALGFSDADYARYAAEASMLATALWQWLSGDVWIIRRGRHTLVEPRHLSHPFVISRGETFPKYGYFLGFCCVEECLATRTASINDWLKTITVDMFERFLNQKRKAHDEKENRHMALLGVTSPLYADAG